MKKRIRQALCLAVMVGTMLGSMVSAQAAGVKGFSDVGKEDWFHFFVTELSSQGVISGYDDGTFQPQRNVTVGETLSLVLKAAGYEMKPATGDHWASGMADFAASNAYLPASLKKDLDAEMTRLQVAQLAAKALKLVPPKGVDSPFADTDDGYVTVLHQKKVLSGSVEDGVPVFKPNDPISRAEISAIVWNIRNTDVHAGQIETEYYYVDVLEGVPVSTFDPERFVQEDGRVDYIHPDVDTMLGVDVASFQGEIDWERVKDDGVDFAIIRIGGRGYTEGKLYEDKNFRQNIEGALDAGLEVGAYFFSQAITEEEALEEAEYVLDLLRPYRRDITFPVVFDWEDLGSADNRTYRLDSDVLGSCANLFCSMMEDAGYDTMIYFNRYGGYRSYDLRQVLDYPFWFAQYLSTTDVPTFYYDFDMWQFTSKGQVDGIEGNVDMNLYFIKD